MPCFSEQNYLCYLFLTTKILHICKKSRERQKIPNNNKACRSFMGSPGPGSVCAQTGGQCGFTEGTRPPARPGIVPVNAVLPGERWHHGPEPGRPVRPAARPCRTVLRRARLRGPIQLLLRTHPQGGPATRRLSGFRRFPVLRRSMLFGSVALGERCTCSLHSVADRCPRSSWLFNARPDSEKVAFVECGLTQSSQRPLPVRLRALDLAGRERADLPGV